MYAIRSYYELLEVEGDEGREVRAVAGRDHHGIHFMDPLSRQELLVGGIPEDRVGADILDRLDLFLVGVDGNDLVTILVEGFDDVEAEAPQSYNFV